MAYLTSDDTVFCAAGNEAVNIDDFIAVAVMNQDNNLFEGVKTTSRGQFVDKVNQAGYCALII